jgi:hypothetical protein
VRGRAEIKMRARVRVPLFCVFVDEKENGRDASVVCDDDSGSSKLQCADIEFLARRDGCGSDEVNQDESGSARLGMLASKRSQGSCLCACWPAGKTATTEWKLTATFAARSQSSHQVLAVDGDTQPFAPKPLSRTLHLYLLESIDVTAFAVRSSPPNLERSQVQPIPTQQLHPGAPSKPRRG